MSIEIKNFLQNKIIKIHFINGLFILRSLFHIKELQKLLIPSKSSTITVIYGGVSISPTHTIGLDISLVDMI